MDKNEKDRKLKQLDENVLNLLIKNTGENGDSSLLTELSVAVNYLKSNQVVSEKPRDSSDDYMKKKVAEAKKRRAKKES